MRATTDQTGHFELTCVPPGGYRLFAWWEIDGEAYRNAEFMGRFVDLGIPVRVVVDSVITVDLTTLDR
jgi:hypothetical protein